MESSFFLSRQLENIACSIKALFYDIGCILEETKMCLLELFVRNTFKLYLCMNQVVFKEII